MVLWSSHQQYSVFTQKKRQNLQFQAQNVSIFRASKLNTKKPITNS